MNEPKHTYGCLSSQRGRLMGAAMLMVVLFHVGGMRHDTLAYCLSRCGNVGVDVFLFLSGIGLWFSWSKLSQGRKLKDGERAATAPMPGRSHPASPILSHPLTSQLLTYFRRRYVRVYPAWLAIACLYYLPRFFDGRLSAADTALSIAVNWGFWEHDELTFWFIPAIMMLYTVAPAYMELVRRHAEWRWMPVAAMLLCVLVQYWPPLHSAVGHLEIFFSRIPIFLIGINAGAWVAGGKPISRHGWWLMAVLFAMSALACVNFEDGLRGRFPLFIERMAYIPLTVSMSLLLCLLLGRAPRLVSRSLAFVGGISLEMYLIHAEYVLKPVKQLHLGYWPTALIVVGASAILAWALHKVVGFSFKKSSSTLSSPSPSLPRGESAGRGEAGVTSQSSSDEGAGSGGGADKQ